MPEECSMDDTLSVGCYEVVFVVREVDETRAKGPEDVLDQRKGSTGCTMFYEHLVRCRQVMQQR
jgi:hypothetical protein